MITYNKTWTPFTIEQYDDIGGEVSFDSVKDFFVDNLSGGNFLDLQHELFRNLDLKHKLSQNLHQKGLRINPFDYALANNLYKPSPSSSSSSSSSPSSSSSSPSSSSSSSPQQGNKYATHLLQYDNNSSQIEIFQTFKEIVSTVIAKNNFIPGDKTASEIQLMSAIAARAAIDSPPMGLDGFDENVDRGAVGLFLSLGFIVPRNAKGQSQARSILENPGSSWSNGQCEHAYAAYGLKIVERGDNTFYWYPLDGGDPIAPVCCYMCRTPLDRKGGPRSMECEHKKPFMRGITDWSLLIKSLFIDDYKAMDRGEWRSEDNLMNLTHEAYIWLLLSSLEYAPSCKSCNQKTGKSNIPLKDVGVILQKFTDNKTSSSSLGSYGQYEPDGGYFHSGIINAADFFINKEEDNVEKKLIKFLFALSDESVLQSIISLYRRGKSINPMQKVLDELKIVAKILSDNQTQVNEVIEIRKQQIMDAIKRAKVIEENCLAKIEMLNLKAEQEVVVVPDGRRARLMQKAADAAAAAAAAAAQALDEQLQTAKQAIIDTRNDQKTFGNLIINSTTINKLTKFFSVDFRSRENGKTFLNQVRTFTKKFLKGEPTISKIINVFESLGPLPAIGGGKGNKIYQSGGEKSTLNWVLLLKEEEKNIGLVHSYYDSKNIKYIETQIDEGQDSKRRRGMRGSMSAMREDEEEEEYEYNLIDSFSFGTEKDIGDKIIEQILNDKYGEEKEDKEVTVELEHKNEEKMESKSSELGVLDSDLMDLEEDPNMESKSSGRRQVSLPGKEKVKIFRNVFDYYIYEITKVLEEIVREGGGEGEGRGGLPVEEQPHLVKVEADDWGEFWEEIMDLTDEERSIPHSPLITRIGFFQKLIPFIGEAAYDAAQAAAEEKRGEGKGERRLFGWNQSERGGKKHTKKLHKRKKHTKKLHKRKKNKRKKHKKKHHKRKKHTKKHHKRKKHTRYKKKNAKQKTKRKKYTRYKN